MKNEQPIARLTAGEGRGLMSTFLLAVCAVILFALLMKMGVPKDSWTHDFFFKRRYVQWVLLMAFAVGFIHLLRRIPVWLKEQKELKAIAMGEVPESVDTMVARRWSQISASAGESRREGLGEYARHLAEHDEAQLDAGYRIPGDIVQILPLIGFFGTVYGLSIGLYDSFIKEGGVTPKAFAHSIAIAFDNTLLGLALTIILFIFQSLLRKREEALLLQLNLLAHDAAGQSADAQPETAIEKSVNTFVERLDELQKLFQTPTNEFKELVRTHATEIASTIANKLSDEQKVKHEELNKLVSEQLSALAAMLSQTVSDKVSALLATDGPFWKEVSGINEKLDSLGKAAIDISTGVSALPKTDHQAQFDELVVLIKELASDLGTRHPEILGKLGDLEEAKKELSVLASETHSLADRVSTLGVKVDALPEERRQIQVLASAIKELAVSLGQRDLFMFEKIEGLIQSQSNDLKSETAKLIGQPRTFTLVEAVGDGAPDGAPKKS